MGNEHVQKSAWRLIKPDDCPFCQRPVGVFSEPGSIYIDCTNTACAVSPSLFVSADDFDNLKDLNATSFVVVMALLNIAVTTWNTRT